MVYFLVGAQLLKADENYTLNEIQNNVILGGYGNSGTLAKLSLEKERFKLGNLDSLMFQNDLMIKLEVQIESLLKKIERQYLDIEDKLTHFDFEIDNRGEKISIDKYIRDFKWDDSRFPRNNQLPDLVKTLANEVERGIARGLALLIKRKGIKRMHMVETDLRQKTQAYQEARSMSQQLSKKEGNLYTKDLVDILKDPVVKPKDFYYTEYLTTVIAIVPQGNVSDFLKNYEFLTENVVPGSAQKFPLEDKDGLTVWRILLVKINMEKPKRELLIPENKPKEEKPEEKQEKKHLSPIELFIQRAKEKKIVIREFQYKAEESQQRDEMRIALTTKTETLTKNLKDTCLHSFSDLYATYIHLKNLRFLVDMVMRFGTGEKTLSVVIHPDHGKEKKIQQSLLKLFGDPSQIGLYGTKEELEDSEDFFPFIYVPINVE